jgi:small GTP-binding protein
MYDVSVKTAIVGETGVGKTSFVARLQYPERPIPKEHTVTIGVDHAPCIVSIKDPHPLKVKFHIWDTAGQERYASITRGFYKTADLVCLMYSCDDVRSLRQLRHRWWKEVREAATNLSTAVILVLGNKKDKCMDERELAEPLKRLMEDIVADTGRQPVHIRLSALKDRTVLPVLEAVAWLCANVPSVQATRTMLLKSPRPSSSIKLTSATMDPSARPSWCCRS